MGNAWRLLATALIVAFVSCFQQGYFMSLYNVPQDIIESYINRSIIVNWHRHLSSIEIATVWSAIASTNQVGRVIGCLVSPIIADRFGRKWFLIYSNFVSVLGILLQYLAMPTGAFLLLAAGRFLTGIYDGIVGVIVPLFLVEIALTPGWRGGVTRIHNVVTILGNIAALLFGVREILGTPTQWGYLALIPLPLVAFETVWLLFVPDSPMYLLQRGKSEEEVKKSLRYYLGEKTHAIENNVSTAVLKKRKVVCEMNWSLFVKEICNRSKLRQLCILWIMLSLASSLSGGALTNNYLTSMIAGQAAQFSDFDKYASVVVNAAKVLVVLAALYVMDKLGRKALLVAAMWSILFCLFVLTGIAFAQKVYMIIDNLSATWSRIVFLFFWISTQYVVNSTATLIVSETALQNLRAISLGIYKLGIHLIAFVLTFAFPPIAALSEGGSYLFVAVPYFFVCVYITWSCPETRTVDFFVQEHSEKTPLLIEETKLDFAKDEK